MITHVVGDLLESGEHVIGHGCNTQGFMGAGIAGLIAEKWPCVFEAYEPACTYGHFRLGGFQVVPTLDGVGGDDNPYKGTVVLNLGTQELTGRNGSYWGIMLSVGQALEWARRFGIKRIALPRIGCGIAGLEWHAVEWMINGMLEEWVQDGPEIVVYTHPKEAHKWTT